ncbi:MFS transporter [Ectobacillus funiculus]|uniref:MFS transporter n=1 Tax=Ectobacillus funiculus TaxID=137993 RepID=UPI00397BC6D3
MKNELFPTNIRGTVTGFGTEVSRIGSSISTFLFPMTLNKYGLEKTLYICAGLFSLRFIISLIMASETKNMSLIEASSLNESGSQKKSTLGFREMYKQSTSTIWSYFRGTA